MSRKICCCPRGKQTPAKCCGFPLLLQQPIAEKLQSKIHRPWKTPRGGFSQLALRNALGKAEGQHCSVTSPKEQTAVLQRGAPMCDADRPCKNSLATTMAMKKVMSSACTYGDHWDPRGPGGSLLE